MKYLLDTHTRVWWNMRPQNLSILLTPIIAYRSTTLPKPFHDDPADQIIVATAREENATILTKDKRILNYQYVQSLW